MSQLRRHSALEALVNTASGFVLSVAAGFVIFPLLGWKVTPGQNLSAVTLFTFISILRSYFWRRVFNWWHHHKGEYNGFS